MIETNLDEYVNLVVNNYMKEWLDYNDDIEELQRATRLGIPRCTKIVVKQHTQFILN